MSNTRSLSKSRSRSAPRKLEQFAAAHRASSHGPRLRRSDGPEASNGNQGFSFTVSMSATTVKYVSWFLTIILLLIVCSYAPDAVVLAAKLKAICEALKALR
jgi:hypothetical protein